MINEFGCLRLCLNKSVYTGREMPVITEATEIVLTIKNTINQVKIIKPKIKLSPAILTDNPINTPKVVAIPLPPLKFKNIVQLWPTMELTPSNRRVV